MPEDNYYVEPRKGWFNGDYNYVVKSRRIGDKIICASAEHGCDVVAHALNTIDNLGKKTP